MLVAVQPYRFCPAGAAVLKNVAPTEQVDGGTVPVCDGLVELAAEKSTLLACVRKSTKVWARNIGRPSNHRYSQTRIDFMIGIVLLAPGSRVRRGSSDVSHRPPPTMLLEAAGKPSGEPLTAIILATQFRAAGSPAGLSDSREIAKKSAQLVIGWSARVGRREL